MASLTEIREEIQLKLTGDLLESELDENTLNKIIASALRELQRYITVTRIITIPFSRCIDLSDKEQTLGEQLSVNSIVQIYRTNDLSGNGDGSSSSSSYDPMQVAQWQLLSGMGNLMYFQDAVYNYSAWTTLQQIRNTTSTDLAFRFDKATQRLYINVSNGTPSFITVEFIPHLELEDIEKINSEYWEDMLIRLALALTKETVGRIRTRYTQSNALWQGDGDRILQEGQEELKEIREMLLNNSDLYFPID